MSEDRDVERVVDKETFIQTLRRAADALEKGEGFRKPTPHMYTAFVWGGEGVFTPRGSRNS